MNIFAVSEAFAEPVAKLDFAAFVARVDQQHPEGQAQKSDLAAARAGLGRSGLPPDPTLSVLREGLPDDDPRWTASLTQAFPWPGSLSAEDRAAEADVDALAATYELARVGRQFAARHTYLHLVEKAKMLEAARENLAQAEKVRSVSEAQFKHGTGSHTEYLQAVSDGQILKANVAALDAELQDLIETAKAMIDLPEGLALDFVHEFPANLVQTGTAPVATGKDEQAAALESAGRGAVLARESDRLKAMPSFSVSAMMMKEDHGMRSYGAAAGVSLPIFSGIRRGALNDEKTLKAEASQGELRWYQKRKTLAVARIGRAIKQNAKNLKVLRDEIIPFSREHSRSAVVAYQQGRGPLSAVVASRSALLDLAQAEIAAEAALAIARVADEAARRGMIEAVDLVDIPPLPAASLAGMSGMAHDAGAMKMRPKKMQRPDVLPSLPKAKPRQPLEPEGGSGMPASGMGM